MGSGLVLGNSRCPRTQDKVAASTTFRLAPAVQILKGAESAPGGAGEGVRGIFKQ